jgi:hypothetical protein
MSAWIPAKEHIDAMVRIIGDTDEYKAFVDGLSDEILGDWHGFTAKEIIGQAITNEVVKSVSTRYPNRGHSLPGARPRWWGELYKYEETTRMPTYAEALKIFDCYDYQACEHEGYEDSFVGKLVKLIRDDLADAEFDMRATDAYKNAPWGWTDEQVRKEKVTVCVDCGSTKGTKEVRA